MKISPANTSSSNIVNKHLELLRLTNSALLTLFWQTGKELNECLDKNKNIAHNKSLIRNVSTRLVASYGQFFTEKNLKKMGLFAEQFPEFSNLAMIATFLSWAHILVLMQIEDPDARLFYIRLTVEEVLSVTGLRKKISANFFEQQLSLKSSKDKRTVKNIPAREYVEICRLGLQPKTRLRTAVKSVFKEPLLSSFRPLLEPASDSASIVKNKKTTGVDEEIYAVFSQHLEKFRRSQNSWLNSYLNEFFWELGSRINQEILLNRENTDPKYVIRNASIQLQKKYGKSFSEDLLLQTMKSAETFSDLHIFTRIGYLVRWEHIVALSSLQDIEATLFYARLTADKGLSVAGLKKQIAKKAFEQTSGAKELEQKMIATIQNPVTEISTEKKGNSTIVVTSVMLNLGDDLENSLAVTNIFNNPHLFCCCGR